MKSKSLRFDSETSFLLIPALASMSDQQLSDLYYCGEADSSRIYQDVISGIRQMQLDHIHNNNDSHHNDANAAAASASQSQTCARGLEHMLSAEHSRSLQAERDALYDAVLDEQDRQWEVNSGNSVKGSSVVDYEDFTVSSKRLADLSCHHSEKAVQRALRLARADAEFVASYNPAPPSPTPPPREAQLFLDVSARSEKFYAEESRPILADDHAGDGLEQEAVIMPDVLTQVLSMSDLMTLNEQPTTSASGTAITSSRSTASCHLPSTTTSTSYHRCGKSLSLPRRRGSDILSSSHHHHRDTGAVLGAGCSLLRRNCTSLLDLKTMTTHPSAAASYTSTTAIASATPANPALPSSLLDLQGEDDSHLFFQLDA